MSTTSSLSSNGKAHPVEEYDVVVIGAGMAGVMAALAAKSPQNKVLLIEPSNVLGGQGTAGGVAGFCGDTEVVNEFFDELIKRLSACGMIHEVHPTADRRDYDLEWCAFFLQEMVRERGVEVLLLSRVIDAKAAEGMVTSLTVSTAGGLLHLRPRFVIDSTGACIVPVLTGFPVEHEGANVQLPMSLYFTMWDTGKKVTPVLPEGCPRWANDDEIPMTSLHLFPTGKTEVKMKVVGFDAADGRSRSEAEMFARKYMHGLIYYLQTVGYRGVKLENSVLASVSRSIGIREERRIIGEHVLTEQEARHAALFPDAIGVCAYHLDYHWPDRMQRGTGGYCDMLEPFQMPLRMMIPKGAKNLLVAGRGSSGDQLAMSAFRVMVPVAQLGFAAGLAARQCIETSTDLTNIDVPRLQAAIRAGGQTTDLSAYGRFLRHDLFAREEIFGNDVPFSSSHTPAIVQMTNARFLVAWSAESTEQGIWLSQRVERRWSTPRCVARVGGESHRQPVLFRAPDDTVRLYFLAGEEPFVAVSRDEGETWEAPRPLTVSIPGQPVVLADGSWLAPGETAHRSTDGGITWVPQGKVSGASSPVIWKSATDSVHMIFPLGDRIGRSDSFDGGLTWGTSQPTEFPWSGQPFALARLDDGMLALVFSDGPALTVALSSDHGATWLHRRAIEEAEYAEPAIFPTRTGMAISYVRKNGPVIFWHGSIDRIITPA